jgi:hypothetical protein
MSGAAGFLSAARKVSWPQILVLHEGCSGRPVNIPPIPHVPGTSIAPDLVSVYIHSACAHPPNRGSCMDCKLPGWRNCNNSLCWSRVNNPARIHAICPECVKGSGVACMCQVVWICDFCTDHFHEVAMHCQRENLCSDCAEEALDADDEVLKRMPVTIVSSCERCDVKVCDRFICGGFVRGVLASCVYGQSAGPALVCCALTMIFRIAKGVRSVAVTGRRPEIDTAVV